MLGITSALIEMMTLCQVIGQMGSRILSAKHDNARATRCLIVTPQKDWKAMLPAAMDFNEVGVYSPLNHLRRPSPPELHGKAIMEFTVVIYLTLMLSVSDKFILMAPMQLLV